MEALVHSMISLYGSPTLVTGPLEIFNLIPICTESYHLIRWKVSFKPPPPLCRPGRISCFFLFFSCKEGKGEERKERKIERREKRKEERAKRKEKGEPWDNAGCKMYRAVPCTYLEERDDVLETVL